MAISYGAPTSAGSYQSNALRQLATIHEGYLNDNINVFSEGFADVLGSQASFTEYVENLLEGTDDATREQLRVLAENTRMVSLTESTISGTNPITALSLPMLRVGFPKMAVREGLPTEPVQQPNFKVTTKRPFIKGSDGVKRYLPEALFESDTYSLPQLETTPLAVTGGALQDYDLLTPISKNAKLGDQIDPKFSVVKVSVTIESVETVRDVNFQLDVNTNTFNGTITDDLGENTATIIGRLNREKGLLSATAIGGVLTELTIDGYVSSEANNEATQIGFDIDGVDCVIGTAQPVESPINIQQMTDVMNMYNVDATLSHIETMTTFLAQNTDREGVRFIDSTILRDVPVADRIEETFDVKTPTNFTHGDYAWREQVRLVLDRLVTRMQTKYNIYSGHTVLFCHPLDAQVISNIKWMYAATEQVNDVVVDYKVGNYISNITSYTVLQSPYFTQGKIRAVYIPSDEEFKTLNYFPYSMHTLRGMVSSSADASNLPAIQMIKRHLFKSFTPMVGELVIENNQVG